MLTGVYYRTDVTKVLISREWRGYRTIVVGYCIVLTRGGSRASGSLNIGGEMDYVTVKLNSHWLMSCQCTFFPTRVNVAEGRR